MKASFSDAQSSGASLLVFKTEWSDDHLDFRASVLGQSATGTVDVADDHVRLEVQLPWLLSLLANKAKALVEKQGKLMLEKRSSRPLREADKPLMDECHGWAERAEEQSGDVPHLRGSKSRGLGISRILP